MNTEYLEAFISFISATDDERLDMLRKDMSLCYIVDLLRKSANKNECDSTLNKRIIEFCDECDSLNKL